MKSLDLVHAKDWKYVGINPDPDFNPEHNNDVIEKTIKEAEKIRRQKHREFNEGLAERAEAIANFVQSVERGGADSDVTRYFGKKHKAYLAGKSAIERIKDGLTSIGANGKIIRKPGEMID